MKKIVSLLLTALILAAMCLPVFAENTGWDLGMKGKWVKYPGGRQPFPTQNTYYYVIEENSLMCTVAIYEFDAAGAPVCSSTKSDLAGNFELISANDVPQSIRDKAAQDYPDLVSTGSTLSTGSIWIIVAVAVVVIGGVAALVVVKNKKKPAQKSEDKNPKFSV